MSERLRLAARARLPLVHVTSADEVRLSDVLAHYVGAAGYMNAKAVALACRRGCTTTPAEGDVHYACGPACAELAWDEVYAGFHLAGATLVVVNGERHPTMFDAGPLYPHDDMLLQQVGEYALEEDRLQLVAALRGLSYRQVREVTALATAARGEFTADSVREVRREFYGEVRGLHPVATDYPMYWCQHELAAWLETNEGLLAEAVPAALRPRGLLFCGPPGTGKTMGAKHVARVLGLPLYLLDVGALLSKWQGLSDQHLAEALQQAERNAPCVLLLDEVEKLFEADGDDGTVRRMLSKVLWWLQEHPCPILTVMTTNDLDRIPPELYRPGRVDATVKFEPLRARDEVANFARTYALTLKAHVEVSNGQLRWALQKLHEASQHPTPAEIVAAVTELAKSAYRAKMRT